MFYWTRYRPPWTHGTCRSWTPTTHSDLLYMFPELGQTWAHSKAGGSRQVFIYGCINRKSSRFFIWSVFPLRTPRYGMALHNNPVFDEQTADWYFGVIRAVVQKKEAWLSSPIQTALSRISSVLRADKQTHVAPNSGALPWYLEKGLNKFLTPYLAWGVIAPNKMNVKQQMCKRVIN